MLANPIYVRADMAVYHYYKEKGITICNEPAAFTGIHGCYLYSGKDGGQCLVIAPHTGLVSSHLWLNCRKKHIKRTRNRLERIMSEHSGRTIEEMHAACERDNYLTAEEALSFGLIDKIITHRSEL
jgi:hypothetical protein